MLNRVHYILVTLLLIALLCGCSNQLPPENDSPASSEPLNIEATVIVTQDFGAELVLEQKINIEPGISAMHALQMVTTVETKYGGGFVSSINGISSEYQGVSQSKKDWFLYINGIASNTGAKDYILRNGDVEHWDFRVWSYHQFIPAITGDFPQPFLSGYQTKIVPTVVVYEEACSAEAEALAKKLEGYGVTEVSAISCDLLSDEAKGNSNLIIIALPENGLTSELNKVHGKLGFYAYMEAGEILVLDANGNLADRLRTGYGLIQATQNPWHPKGVGAGESVVWIVTGTDRNGVKSAATVLADNPDGLRYTFAVLISNDTVRKIPE
jgi:hypothetical protein